MSYLAAPPESPIDIDGDIQYKYVIAQQGATSMTVDADADFEFTLTLASPALLTVKYIGAVGATPTYHTVTVRVQMPEGALTHTPYFQVLPTSATQRVPNITNGKSSAVAPGAAVDVTIATDIAVDSFNATNLPAGLAVSTSTGRITGTLPDDDSGFYVITFVANKGSYSYKRYYVFVVGTGQSGTPGAIAFVLPNLSGCFFDGDHTTPQLAGPPSFEVPFKTDPLVYAYRLKYWQFLNNYSETAIGSIGPMGGTFVGTVPGSFKSIGGAIVEFDWEYAVVPRTRSEYESFVYSFQFVVIGQAGITELPFTVQSRIQFDYFQTDDPTTIDLPLAPRVMELQGTMYFLNGWYDIQFEPAGTEFLAEDATYKCWLGNIYERQQRFVRSIKLPNG